MTPETAEILAFEALGWLAGEPEELQKFLNLSGLDVGALRDAAGSPEVSVAILDYLLAHEELLLRFCEATEAKPRDLHLARHVLGGI
jgi:hypothetical protein